MADDLRQRCADAAMKAWGEQAVLCDHSQIIPIGSIVDAVLAERDDELAALRRELESVTDRMEADRLKHRAERDIWKECDEKQWLQIRAGEAAIAYVRADCEAQRREYAADVSRDCSRGGIWSQATRTLNILGKEGA